MLGLKKRALKFERETHPEPRVSGYMVAGLMRVNIGSVIIRKGFGGGSLS